MTAMNFRNLLSIIHRSSRNCSAPDSVYFYTFHKCASTLFAKHVLKNVRNLKHVDHAAQIFRGLANADAPLAYHKQGHIYGPIRISLDNNGPVHERVVIPCTQPDFVRDKSAVFLVRDPRDILVSSYYSFGFNHALSRVREIREKQQRQRDEIQKQSIDEFAVERADGQIRYFKLAFDLSRACKKSVVLRYEDMIHDFDAFVSQLTTLLPMTQAAIDELKLKSRPRERELEGSHRRSGKTHAYIDKLKPETIEILNNKLREPMELFGYLAD